jgi:hypothetical protein
MSKNLISRLGKLALIPALAFSLSAKNIDAQKSEHSPKLSYKMDITSAINYAVKAPKPYENWESHFLDPIGGMNLSKKIYMPELDCSFGLDFYIPINKTDIGLSCDLPLYSFCANRSLSKFEINDWKSEPVTLCEYKFRQTTPNLGAFVRFPVREDWDLGLKASLQNYKFYQENHQDKNFKENAEEQKLKCDGPTIKPTEQFTDIFEKTKKQKIQTLRLGLELLDKEKDNGTYSAYYESDFKTFHRFGISLGFNSANK